MYQAQRIALRWLTWFAIATGVLVAALLLAGSLHVGPGEMITPAGLKRNTAVYVTMRDGVRIAVDVWLPKELAPGEHVPSLIRATRYWRATEPTWIANGLAAVGVIPDAAAPQIDVATMLEHGYAVVLVDARGSGASFGDRPIPWSKHEIQDYKEIVDWIVRQPWSNGRVGAFGVSYNGEAAELIATTGHPAVKAVAPLFALFDAQYEVARPGGVFNEWFTRSWGMMVAKMDRNNVCVGLAPCPLALMLSNGVKPVDGPDGEKLLQHAIAQRRNADIYAAVSKIRCARDEFGDSGLALTEVVGSAHQEQLERYGVPMYVRASWTDSALVTGAIARFRNVDVPQRVVIGAWSHGGAHGTDPFVRPDAPAVPSLKEQYEKLAAWFEPYLRGNGDPRGASALRYYTLGGGSWMETRTWPPADVIQKRFYFAEGRSLSRADPVADTDSYEVDFTASTGSSSRWKTSIGGGDVVYPDRQEEDRKLLTYTTEPFDRPFEVTGTPTVSLKLSVDSPDAALHVYLEDVAPDGRATYVTEGVLRLRHRKVATSGLRYDPVGPAHSFECADVQPITPGESTSVAIGLYPVSARIERDHRLRVAISGADASVFERIPASGSVHFELHRGAGSHVDLPIREAEPGGPQ